MYSTHWWSFCMQGVKIDIDLFPHIIILWCVLVIRNRLPTYQLLCLSSIRTTNTTLVAWTLCFSGYCMSALLFSIYMQVYIRIGLASCHFHLSQQETYFIHMILLLWLCATHKKREVKMNRKLNEHEENIRKSSIKHFLWIVQRQQSDGSTALSFKL